MSNKVMHFRHKFCVTPEWQVACLIKHEKNMYIDARETTHNTEHAQMHLSHAHKTKDTDKPDFAIICKKLLVIKNVIVTLVTNKIKMSMALSCMILPISAFFAFLFSGYF